MDKSGGHHYQKLPPGWDCKYDQSTGNCYYINYLTRAMQLEDPRTSRYKQLQNERSSTESIPLQPVHGGSPYHVYPSNNMTALRAFQLSTGTGSASGGAHSSNQNMSASPLLSSRGNLEMSPLPIGRSNPINTPRHGNLSRRSTIQETSFSSSNQIDTDAVVAKIQNMFPTAGENHIRLLLKKYYNREAVVISALQVEKHPVTMPGPFVTPPAQRHLFHSNSAFYMTPPARRLELGGGVGSARGVHATPPLARSIASGTSRTASPAPGGRFGSVMSMHSGSGSAAYGRTGIGFMGGKTIGGAGPAGGDNSSGFGYAPLPYYHASPRYGDGQWQSSPRPHSSPKMKLRYMKNIFPKADEMLLLDVLANVDNNVQKATEQLLSLGYAKREHTNTLRQKQQTNAEVAGDQLDANGQPKKQTDDEETLIPLRPKEYTSEEKTNFETQFKQKYPNIAERIIVMALESVNYAEDRAQQILQIVQEEDETRSRKGKQSTVQHGDNTGIVHKRSASKGSRKEAANASDDNILTVVVLETTPPSDKALSSKTMKLSLKKRQFPSINLITPTTATTQIILSNSPIFLENGAPGLVESEIIKDDDDNDDATTITTTNNNNKALKKRESKKYLKGVKKNTQATVLKSSASSPPSPQHAPSSSSSVLSPQSIASSSSSSSSSPFSILTTKQMLAHSHSNTFSVNDYLHGCSNNNHTTTTSSCNKNNRNVSTLTSSKSSSSIPMSTNSILEKDQIQERSRDKGDSLKHGQNSDSPNEIDHSAEPDMPNEFESIIGRLASMGHNTELSKGPDMELLLVDYVTWNGANPNMSLGSHKNLVAGADSNLIAERNYTPLGRNSELCKGPKAGLAKGSLYAQLSAGSAVGSSKGANIKCN